MSARRRADTRQGRVRTRSLAGAGMLAGGAVALLLLAGLLYALGNAPWAAFGSVGRPSPGRAARTIDPRLIVRPRTLTQAATLGGLRVALAVSPVLPGPNRFALRLVERGRPVGAAHVRLIARMTEMAMRPVALAMREGRRGRYAAGGLLAMFGHWRLTIHIDRPGMAPLTHRFAIGVNLPAGLMAGQRASGATHP